MTSITSTAQWSTRINQVIFAVLDVSWTMGLNSDKTSKVFCINQQYRRFPSIFRVEYEVGNWPLTGSMSLVGIRKSGIYYRIRPSTRLTTLLVSNRGSLLLLGTRVRRLDLLLLVWKRTISETKDLPSTRLTPASLNSGYYTTGN